MDPVQNRPPLRGKLSADRGAKVRASNLLAGDTVAQLWFEEADKHVWHLMTRKADRMDYHAACGWHLAPHTGRIWPQKPSENGPDEETRCRTCIGEE